MPSRVLVIDDEVYIRELARRTLEKDGYDVSEASTGPEAIELLSQGAQFDLLLADLNMPEMPGGEMVRRIRASQPDLKVLYVTGLIDQLMNERSLWEGEAFLDKPFSSASLREAVSLLLYGSLTKKA